MTISDYTVKFPLEPGKVGIFETLTGNDLVEVVRYNIKSTLLTCPGERPFQSDFGFCLRKYLFETPTQKMLQEMHSGIMNQISEHVSYIYINNLTLTVPEDSLVLRIRLSYVIAEVNVKDEFDFTAKINL